MQGGDIDNRVPGRMIFVWEDTIAYLPSSKDYDREERHIRRRRWDKAVAMWEVSQRADALLWDLAWRFDYRFDVITYKPQGFADALKDRLDEEHLPFSNCWATTPSAMAQKLAFMPDVIAVYDGNPERLFTYGRRGKYLEGGMAAARSLW